MSRGHVKGTLRPGRKPPLPSRRTRRIARERHAWLTRVVNRRLVRALTQAIDGQILFGMGRPVKFNETFTVYDPLRPIRFWHAGGWVDYPMPALDWAPGL